MQVDLFGACFRAPHLTCSVSPAADINPVGFYLDVKVHLIEPFPTEVSLCCQMFYPRDTYMD